MIDNGALTHPKIAKRFLTITSPGAAAQPIAEKIRQRAYQLYDERGRGDGHALDDWLRAETEIRKRRI